jgi:hypothetical protein
LDRNWNYYVDNRTDEMGAGRQLAHRISLAFDDADCACVNFDIGEHEQEQYSRYDEDWCAAHDVDGVELEKTVVFVVNKHSVDSEEHTGYEEYDDECIHWSSLSIVCGFGGAREPF